MQSAAYQLMRELEDSHWWFVARRKIIAAALRGLGLSPKSEVLEVGCGTGGNIGLLNQFGNLTCVEQDESAARMARLRGGAVIHPGALPDDLPEFPGLFDLVAAFDVIEHVDADAASVRTLASLVKPGGALVLTVPAFNFLWSRHDDENHHKRRYRKKDLEKLARLAGLETAYISYFNFWLFLPVAAVRLVRRVLPYTEPWRDMRQPGRLVNQALICIFGSERFAMGRITLPFGISLIAVLLRGSED